MLKFEDIIADLDLIEREQYTDMLKQVNIPDFVKCIAQFSGIAFDDIKDSIIKEYLITWAKNKYRFFKMLGNKLRLDTNIDFKSTVGGNDTRFKELEKKYPAYSLWLDNFSWAETNKINHNWQLSYHAKAMLHHIYPDISSLEGMTLTHLFKKLLNAPDELVTDIAAVYENKKVKAIHTISIDPVDMMLASENPYDWTSCYKLELGNDGIHADGCLAAVLDSTSLITYIWNSNGKFILQDTYKFKDIRYKRMRQWISISENMTSIHFNDIYPGKGKYDNEFRSQLRDVVETIVAKYLGKIDENVWTRDNNSYCSRLYPYGYGEFHSGNIYKLKGADDERFKAYDTKISCPCGCGDILPGSDDESDGDGEYVYNGEGFTYENFDKKYYCEYAEEYCDCADDICAGNCGDCMVWQNQHPVCSLDEITECEDSDYLSVYDGIAHCNSDHCNGCALYKQHHPDEEEE